MDERKRGAKKRYSGHSKQPIRKTRTNKQQVFVEEYLKCWNASEAARRAGYSKQTAGEIGYENLKKPEIVAEIKQRLEELKMSSDEVLVRITEQARGDISDFIDVKNKTISLTKAKRAGKLHLLKKFTRSETLNGVNISIEMYDAQAALVLIGRYHKLFVDKSELGGPNGTPIPIGITEMEAIRKKRWESVAPILAAANDGADASGQEESSG